MQTFAVEVRCVACGEVEYIYVRPMDYVRWTQGTHAQDAFPYLTIDEREAIITSMCLGCIEEMYSDMEEDDDWAEREDWDVSDVLEMSDFPEYESDYYVDCD